MRKGTGIAEECPLCHRTGPHWSPITAWGLTIWFALAAVNFGLDVLHWVGLTR